MTLVTLDASPFFPASLGLWSVSRLEVMSCPTGPCGWPAPPHRVPGGSTTTWKRRDVVTGFGVCR